ncbi:TonB-dependent receptor [Chitinophagaceae bacterium MMS25-I14]
MYSKLLFSTGTVVLLCNIANAQSADSSFSKQQLQPVEVRALRAGTDAPFAKTEITAKDLSKANLGQDLPMLLQYTPSAVVTSDAGAGVGYTGLRIRGTDGSRINVTLNGVPVNDAESQGAFFVDLPDLASSVSSIQLQRGAGTSTNGPGAFGATMSISTLAQRKEAGAEGDFSFGSFNTQKYTVSAGTGLLSNGFQLDVRLSKISSDGYIQRSASDLKSLQILAGWQLSPKTSLHFVMLTGKEKTGQAWNGVPGDSLHTNRTYNELGQKADGSFYDNQTDNYQQNYYQLFADHKFSNHLTAHAGLFLTRGFGYYEEYQLGQSFSDYGLPAYVPSAGDTLSSTDLIRRLWLDNYYYGGLFSLMYEKKNTSVTFGGLWSQYEGKNYGNITWAQYGVPDNYRWYIHDAQKNDLNFYLKAQHTFAGKLIAYADLQYRNVAYFINGFRNNPDVRPAVNYNFFNPKLGLTWLIQQSSEQRQKAYASFAIANKEPNKDDFEAAGNALPKPERLYDWEAGYEVSNQHWTAGFNLYYMDYKDQLVYTGRINDVGAYTRTNVPQSYRAGIELQGAWMPVRWLKAFGNATFSENKIKNFTEYIDNYDDNAQTAVNHGNSDIALSPSTIASAGVSLTPFRKQDFSFDILGKYVGKQYLDNSGDNNRSLDAYGLCDIRIHYGLKIKPFKEVGLTLAVNNLFNNMYSNNGYVYYTYISGGTQYYDNRYFPQAGTNWLLGLHLKW